MQHEPSPRTKLLFSVIGLSAVALPVLLIATNFQPWGFLISSNQPTLSPTPVAVTQTASPSASITPTIEIAMLSQNEFNQLKTNSSVSLFDIRGLKTGALAGSKVATVIQVETLLQQSKITGTYVVLVSNDLTISQPLAVKIIKAGFQTGIYLVK